MLMSQPAICAGVAVWPRFGLSVTGALVTVALAQPTSASATAAHARSRVDMLHLPVRLDGPRLDRVVMEDGIVPVLGDELVALGLYGAGAVGRARFHDHRAPTPLPRHAEAGDRSRQHGWNEGRDGPCLAAIGRHLHLGDGAVARPRDARDFVEPGATQRAARRRAGDERLHFHRVREHEGLPIGLYVGV